jgi:hypothetical protein
MGPCGQGHRDLIKRLLKGVDSDVNSIGQCGKLINSKSHGFIPSSVLVVAFSGGLPEAALRRIKGKP